MSRLCPCSQKQFRHCHRILVGCKYKFSNISSLRPGLRETAAMGNAWKDVMMRRTTPMGPLDHDQLSAAPLPALSVKGIKISAIYVTWNVQENMIQHELFPLVSRFPRYISCSIPENRLPLGQSGCPPKGGGGEWKPPQLLGKVERRQQRRQLLHGWGLR